MSDDWADHCVATFLEDYDVIDSFGDPAFTAKSGDSYLISALDSFSGHEATLLYLTAVGPGGFDVPNGVVPRPFTTDCTTGSVVQYYAVFDNVSVYSNDTLDEVLCELPAGHVVKSDESSEFSTSKFKLSGPTTYEITLGGLSAECGDAATGYVSVPETELWGTTTWLIPIRPILGPAPAE